MKIGSLFVAPRCVSTREQTVVARFVETGQGFFDLLAQLIGVATLGVDKRDHIEVKRRSFKIILGERFLGSVDLLACQCVLFFLVQRFHLFPDSGVTRVVGEALQVIEIPRQRPPFFDGHVSVHQRVELADRGFSDGADIVSRSDTDQIHRPEQTIRDAAPKISRALTH